MTGVFPVFKSVCGKDAAFAVTYKEPPDWTSKKVWSPEKEWTLYIHVPRDCDTVGGWVAKIGEVARSVKPTFIERCLHCKVKVLTSAVTCTCGAKRTIYLWSPQHLSGSSGSESASGVGVPPTAAAGSRLVSKTLPRVRVDSLISYGGNGIYDELAKMGHNTFNCSPSVTANGADPTHEEMYASIPARVPSEMLTKEELYERCAGYQTLVANREAFEETRMNKMTPDERNASLHAAQEAMLRHQAKYDELFQPWKAKPWINYLKVKHDARKVNFESNPAQPNPWEDEGIETTSKSYLINIMEKFKETSPSAPVCTLERVCKKVAGILNSSGDACIEFRMGPLKKRDRIFEKVLMNLDGRFDLIRDYARAYIVIKEGHFDDMPLVTEIFDRNEEVQLIRAKNRFDPEYDARTESAGYRDYQVILKTKDGGWLLELQIIPEEMLFLKENGLDNGHADYTDYRFTVEAARNLAKKEAEQARGRPTSMYFDGSLDLPFDRADSAGFQRCDDLEMLYDDPRRLAPTAISGQESIYDNPDAPSDKKLDEWVEEHSRALKDKRAAKRKELQELAKVAIKGKKIDYYLEVVSCVNSM